MLFDVRTYSCKPGTVNKQLALYEDYGYGAQVKYLGKPLVYLVTESGPINSYMHVWVYSNAADREDKRKRLGEDPEWNIFMEKSAEAGYLISQENKLMVPSKFTTQLSF